MTSPLRGPRAQKEAASPPLIFRCAAQGTERPSGPKGAAHRAARDSPAGCPDPGDHCGPWDQEKRAGPGLPPAMRAARKPPAAGPGVRKHPDPEGNR